MAQPMVTPGEEKPILLPVPGTLSAQAIVQFTGCRAASVDEFVAVVKEFSPRAAS
jgi:hypothetical protein